VVHTLDEHRPIAGRARRRRPVGEPPPLPRDLHGTARIWLAIVAALTLVYLWGKYGGPLAGSVQRSLDGWVTDVVVDPAQRGWPDEAADDMRDLFGVWAVVALRWAVVFAMIAFRRWRHVAVFVGTVVLINVLATWFPMAGPAGHAPGMVGHPSLAEAGFVVTMLGIVYGLAPKGPWRVTTEAVTVVTSVWLGAVLILTDQNTFAEVAVGGLGAAAIGVLGYRVFAPEAVFPVRYRRGRTAHLEMTPERTRAIVTALRDQLGLDVERAEPFGLAGSGGSTPLRIQLADGSCAFGKLYATNHLRSDRWYKLGRTIMYGALEDERSFNSVRRMVEYEDHMLRYLRDHGVPTADPIGIAELTPEREYLLVTSFINGAREITDGPVDPSVIDSGLGLVRGLWDAGVAHRDIKPANLLVRDHEVIVIDVFFCQVRPSPWRQSVDLANMMLTLALRSDARVVYDRATERFSEEEIAEAFAATRGVTIPSQLRRMLHRDDPHLVETFRALAPPRRRISVQRWTLRRLALMAGLAGGLWIALATAYDNLHPAGFGT
jgi:tRNA A-37 threonylcarbamoyl transferase component Bud32